MVRKTDITEFNILKSNLLTEGVDPKKEINDLVDKIKNRRILKINRLSSVVMYQSHSANPEEKSKSVKLCQAWHDIKKYAF